VSLFLFHFPAHHAHAGDYSDMDMNKTDAAGLRQGHWTITALMMNREGYPSPMAIVLEGNYINNKREGTWIEYYPNGKKKSELIYWDDVPDGLCKTFYPDGKICTELNYANSLPKGVGKTFYPDGKLWTEFTWKNGRLDGPAKTFHPNGKVCEEGTWVHNWWSGEYKIY